LNPNAFTRIRPQQINSNSFSVISALAVIFVSYYTLIYVRGETIDPFLSDIDITTSRGNKSETLDASEDSDKYKKDKMDWQLLREYAHELKDMFETDKPFLDPDFSIQNLMERLNVSKHQLSQIINRYFEISYNEFVNNYKIQEAMSRLCQNKYSEWTILRIGLESGFYAKSRFNSIFKKHTGQTPTFFRKNCTDREIRIS